MQSTPHDRVPGSTMASPQQSISSMVSSPQHPASNLNLRVRTRGISSIQDSTMEICDFSGPPSFQSTDMSFENLDQSRRSDVSRSSVSSTLASVSFIVQWKLTWYNIYAIYYYRENFCLESSQSSIHYKFHFTNIKYLHGSQINTKMSSSNGNYTN